ncbi:MAG: hypothetical protein LCH84_13220 [Gemmatimonadetes bacterium]|nr:hypothetical protein [Gemmatimonadota bacterium]
MSDGRRRRRGRGIAALLTTVVSLLGVSLAARPAGAQAVLLDGPSGATFSSVTPSFGFRAIGLGPGRPLLVTLQLSTTLDFTGVVFDSSFTTPDTVLTIQVTRPLPHEAGLYVRARARAFAGPLVESTVTGPFAVPSWLTLITPNSPTGNSFAIRRPLFVWRSARILPSVGPWRYDLELTSAGRPELAVVGLTDTTFRPTTDLQANTSYRWSVRAWLPSGESIRLPSLGTFVITDPPLPTTTLLFQNFPNPFPSPSVFFTCFWFDVGQQGASLALEVLDARGTLVKTIVPKGTRFEAGRYGRGLPGGESNCDNRYTWDGTANDGRVVTPGVYLARFSPDNAAPTFRRIVFKGR